MNNNRQPTSIVASPILIGAVTTLVVTVAVFMSYNANQGLPFVPTYNSAAHVPSGAGLIEGNEVRIGGHRVGVVTSIDAVVTKGAPTALLHLKLDKTAEPIYTGARITVRPRSPLGLKYLEVIPLKTGRKLAQGQALPLSAARRSVDLDEVVTSLNPQTRRSLQLTVTGLGTGFAGRGADLNYAISQFPPLLRRGERVAANLGDPATRLAGLIQGAEQAASEVAPVAPQLGSMVRGANVTAGALASVTPQIRQVLEGLPPTEEEATRTLLVARPVMHDARLLIHDIRPGTRVLGPAATSLHRAIVTGIPVVRHALKLSDRLRTALAALGSVASDKFTTGALKRLMPTVETALPVLRFIVPAQTVCNNLGLWTRNVDSTISEGDDSGTWFRTLVVANTSQARAHAETSPDLHNNTYGNTAAPGQVHECETGNEPYLSGQRFGHVPGNQGARTQTTSPPEGLSGR
jgi:ABC-type transporter Mla subunit MlaD